MLPSERFCAAPTPNVKSPGNEILTGWPSVNVRLMSLTSSAGLSRSTPSLAVSTTFVGSTKLPPPLDGGPPPMPPPPPLHPGSPAGQPPNMFLIHEGSEEIVTLNAIVSFEPKDHLPPLSSAKKFFIWKNPSTLSVTLPF